MMAKFYFFREHKWPDWIAPVIAVLGLIAYLVQAVIFAHTTVPNLDEGAYLLKGILFASGKYHPFDPGIWTNKAPLAFLIPGYVQLVFGAGLRSGRYLAVFFGTMAVVGTWVAARRLGGKWPAAAAVWILTLSPAVIKFYSGAATQSTIACLLAWSLALSLGEDRPAWQLALSGFLAGVMLLVRQNMVPVLPLLILYAFWQHKWKAIWLLLAGSSVVVAVHVMYWPNILRIWTWLPIRFPAAIQLGYTGGGTPSWSPEIGLGARILSIFQATRIHFAVLMGGIFCFVLWPRQAAWKSTSESRVALFLFALFWGLVYLHSTAAIGQDYCVYCFAPYIAFFNVAGILLLVLMAGSWNPQPSRTTLIALIVVFLLISSGMGYSAFQDIGSFLLRLPAPRVRDMRILPGLATWWDILSNGFHLDQNMAKRYASTVAGFLAAAFVTIFVYALWRWVRRSSIVLSFGMFYAYTILTVGIIASPLLHGTFGYRDCQMDVIKANEQIGAYLRSIVPAGSLIYWNGGLSTVPLLYLPEAEIIPAQINDGYAFYGGGDAAQLYEFGLWNEEMDAGWKATADFIIIEESRYPGWQGLLTPDRFDEFERTAAGTSCQAGSRLRIFRRK